MLEAYRQHVEERAAEGVPPKPLTAEQVAALIELLKAPPAGEEEFILDLITNRVPPGVDEAAYVKAGFLTAIAKGEATSPLIDKIHAVKLLGTMQGGYNIATLVELLERLGLSARELMRKGEDTYKELNLANPELSEAQLVQAMVDYPKLIERPIVIREGKAVIGRPPERVLELFE